MNHHVKEKTRTFMCCACNGDLQQILFCWALPISPAWVCLLMLCWGAVAAQELAGDGIWQSDGKADKQWLLVPFLFAGTLPAALTLLATSEAV